jgi:hypothetical protein
MPPPSRPDQIGRRYDTGHGILLYADDFSSLVTSFSGSIFSREFERMNGQSVSSFVKIKKGRRKKGAS